MRIASMNDIPGCLGCDLANGRRDLPGGRIYETTHWVVEHCIGPLGVGTLIVKPFRHVYNVWELTDDEAKELGPLLRRVAATIRVILAPDQVYTCEWSHMGFKPGHLHFVLQPIWNAMSEKHERPGPFLQSDMFKAKVMPPREEVEAFANRARSMIKSGEHWKEEQ